MFQPRILVDVHPVLLEGSAVSQPQLPRSGPDGQPIESSQLALISVRQIQNQILKGLRRHRRRQ